MKTADPELMRAINRFHVMDAIRRIRTDVPGRNLAIHGTQPHHRLGDHGGAARRRADHPDAGRRACAMSARGRPRVMLKLNPDAARVVGVKLAPDQITVAVSNFRADVLRSTRAADPHRPADGERDRRSGRGRRSPLRLRR